MNKLFRLTTLLSLAILSLLLVDACAGRAGGLLHDAGVLVTDAGLTDAGSLLTDAGNALSDSGLDASAQSGVGIDSHDGSRIHVRRVAYLGADGSRYDTGATELTDTQLGIVCTRSAYPMSDGTRRCLPASVAFGAYPASTFADAGCSAELVTAGACTLSPNAAALVQQSSGTCANASGTVVHAYQIGAEHSGTIYLKAGASCVATTPSPAARYYLKGAEIPPSTYVELTDAP